MKKDLASISMGSSRATQAVIVNYPDERDQDIRRQLSLWGRPIRGHDHDSAPPQKAFACNCSICSRVGWLLAFVPETGFRLIAGEGNLGDYQFNKKHVHHLFCRTCGIRSFAHGKGKDGKEMYSINLRCLADIDPTALPVEKFNGAAI